MVIRREKSTKRGHSFQYSLCRVVLMVELIVVLGPRLFSFQYSLCRVVLMVLCREPINLSICALSVLALSSRFDGRADSVIRRSSTWSLSVLALSSRFDGLAHRLRGRLPYRTFQYSLCRVVLMVAAAA